jgi:uncharacterized Ntn-hydrolase superfamily protein
MTYSIIAHDARTGELGIAVQSRFFAAGRIVPWIEAGVGVVASQAFANPVYGTEGLRLLRSGMSPQDALELLRRDDPGAALRQVAIMNAAGSVAVHTGVQCVAAAGHAVGTGAAAQANMMARPTVWQAMIAAFEKGEGALADRLLAALDAAGREGGDLRGAQAAALVVVGAHSSGDAKQDRIVDLRVDDHPDPAGEIRRLYALALAHHEASAALEKLAGGDPAGALAELDSCCAAWPQEPEFLSRRALVLMAMGRFPEARAMMERASAINPGWAELILRMADAGIIPASREMLAPLVAGLVPDR